MSEVAGGTSVVEKGDPEMKGWLLKWTNYLKGYQRRWFVLSNGVLSYYRKSNSRNQAEMAHTCRGTISLHGALIHTVDSCTFVISNGGTQTFHIKAANEVERQSWVTALELAKAKAIRAMESDEDEDETASMVAPSQEINVAVKELTERLENLRTCSDLITKHGLALQRALADLESGDDFANRSKIVNERATLFRITSNAMINACSDYLKTAESQGQKWSKMLQHEREKRQSLEEMVEQLAKQHTQLEQAAHRIMPNSKNTSLTNPDDSLYIKYSATSDDDDIEFYDAQEDNNSLKDEAVEDSSFILKIQTRRLSRDRTGSSSESEEVKAETKQVLVVPENDQSSESVDTMDHQFQTVLPGRFGSTVSLNRVIKNRRTRVPDKPNYPLNLWSIMKNCIGKELSKIPMPVNFNEPLSMLQRLTEDYEYADLLDKAAQCSDPCEQLAYVAAFSISSYSTTANRTGKPFNPLLGETYECDRMDDLGWRVIAEQVSHHPPMAAIHCEGKTWNCWQEFTMTSKFRGKYLQVVPLGNACVGFASGQKYSWRKVTTTVHNIIVGKLWIDNHGETEIIGQNKAKGLKCHLKYIPYSYFTRDAQRKVKGIIMNEENEVKWVLRGIWDNKIEIASVISTSGSAESPVYKTGSYRTIWTRRPPPEDSEKYYNFTILACQLNEMEEGIAPTDSRLRPDQRLMEEGRWEESNVEKMRLEEKQRIKRRARESDAESAASQGRPYPPYEPCWFVKQQEDDSENVVHVYKGNYWEHKMKQDWSVCPDLF
ncbi:oxysterol-binding protein 1 isoform X1 [Episyrphus balteatus]|uniref:oxysterol-binding protein 1 isoform X1 n=1 Tax=Episyrphus balteatus TaxID=286459 RepID=UPI00248642D4|nr:oxysterol-binding protein 1 isoform X1 [Episyrphus balteatus]XP_055847101.1 oxysterol-binding protein 1 isoform X1 [Episyrphus balteatus]XP_055847102.1 oxysterol-binding protein 1 isoform X1 [Episyrphus balteatus]